MSHWPRRFITDNDDEDSETLDEEQNIDHNADEENTGESSEEFTGDKPEDDSEDYSGETLYEDEENLTSPGFSPETSGGSPKQSQDASSALASNAPSQRQSGSIALSSERQSDDNPPPAHQSSAEGQKMSRKSIDEPFRPSRPEGRRDEGDYEEEIAKRKSAAPQVFGIKTPKCKLLTLWRKLANTISTFRFNH